MKLKYLLSLTAGLMVGCSGMSVTSPSGAKLTFVEFASKQSIESIENGEFKMKGYAVDSEEGAKTVTGGIVSGYGIYGATKVATKYIEGEWLKAKSSDTLAGKIDSNGVKETLGVEKEVTKRLEAELAVEAAPIIVD